MDRLHALIADAAPAVTLSAVGGLRVRRWGNEVVVYDAAAAQTHLLSGLIGQVFERLREAGAQSSPALEVWLAGNDSELDAEERASLAGIIDDLVHLGLVERLPS